MINGSTKLYGIIGNPVKHSLSPVMHNRAFQQLGLNCVYVPFCVETVESAVKSMKTLGISGASVTVPHKQDIISQLDEVMPVALKIGAVNTLVYDDERNVMIGTNTDWVGANMALEEKVDLDSSKVILLGSGGAARAIGFGLLEAGAEVVICSRTRKTGELLAIELGCQYEPLENVNTMSADILVNGTSVGMFPNDSVSIVDRDALMEYSVVMDIVYAPLQTRLLREAEEQGCTVINGLEMLLYQGVAQFEMWTDKIAPVDIMRQELLQATGNV